MNTNSIRAVQATTYTGRLDSFINKYLIEHRPIPESTIHRISKRALQGLAVISGMGARVPFIRVNLAYSSNAWGIILASNSAASFGSIIAWCLLNIINDKLKPLSREEKRLLRSQIPIQYRVAISICMIAGGIIAQAPLAYMAYAYNNDNIYFPILVLLVDSGYPIYSLHLGSEQLLKKRRLNALERQLDRVKDQLVGKLERSRTTLAVMTPEGREKYLTQLQNIKLTSDRSKLSTKYLKALITNSLKIKNSPENRVIKAARILPASVGVTLAISQLIFAAVLTYHGAKLFLDNDPFSISWAAFVVLCNTFLNFSVMVGTSISAYDTGIKYLRGIPQQSLIGSLYPKTQACSRLISLCISALSFGGPLKVAQDYLSGGFGLFIQISSVMATIMLSIAAMFALVDDLMTFVGIHYGSKEHQELIKLDFEIKRLINLIKESPFVDFLQFLDLLPRKKYMKWINKLQIKEQDLQDYLTSISESEPEPESDTTPLMDKPKSTLIIGSSSSSHS